MKLKIRDMRWENKSLYLFLEELELNKCNNGVCREWHEVFGWDLVERESEWSYKVRGKTEMFKNWPYFCHTFIFRDWGESPTSHQGKPPRHSKKKIVKKFLSVFHNWKVYPRGSRKLSHKNLCVPFMTGPFTHEQVAKINTQTRYWSMRLGWPMTESTK